jgi:Lar family restriction alleviation protein
MPMAEHNPRAIAPCPFCGSERLSLITTTEGTPQNYVVCGDCETEGPIESDATDAEQAWNRRVAGPPSPAVNELRAQNERLQVQVTELTRICAEATPPAQIVIEQGQLVAELQTEVTRLNVLLAELAVDLELTNGDG